MMADGNLYPQKRMENIGNGKYLDRFKKQFLSFQI